MLEKDQKKRWGINYIKDYLIDELDINVMRKLDEFEIQELIKNYIKNNSVG